MYIFGVYECVFSVVAVDSQPAVCKGLQQTIVQSYWSRQTEEATRINDVTNTPPAAITFFCWIFFSPRFYPAESSSCFVFNFIFFKCRTHVKTITGGVGCHTLWRMATVPPRSARPWVSHLRCLAAEQGTLSCVVRLTFFSKWIGPYLIVIAPDISSWVMAVWRSYPQVHAFIRNHHFSLTSNGISTE